MAWLSGQMEGRLFSLRLRGRGRGGGSWRRPAGWGRGLSVAERGQVGPWRSASPWRYYSLCARACPGLRDTGIGVAAPPPWVGGGAGENEGNEPHFSPHGGWRTSERGREGGRMKGRDSDKPSWVVVHLQLPFMWLCAVRCSPPGRNWRGDNTPLTPLSASVQTAPPHYSTTAALLQTALGWAGSNGDC